MSAPSVSWDETAPAGSDSLNQGDNRIREMKTQIREVIDVDHKFASSGSDADNGCHDQVTLLEKADIGTGAVGKTILGSQTVSGLGELLYTNENDVDIQITKNDKIMLDSGRLSNNTNLIARNAANSGNINILKVNASDIVEVTTIAQLKNASVMESAAAPTTDAMISNKKYVDDKVAAVPAQVGFGSWVSKSIGTTYQAATDGFVVGWGQADNGDTIDMITDSNTSPTTIRQSFGTGSGTTSVWVTFCFPVKKNDYYLVKQTAGSAGPTSGMYFLPLGS